MKIILLILGTVGDARPMLAMGLTLRKAGHQVEICVPPNLTQLVSQYGFKSYPFGFDFQKIFEEQKEIMGSPMKGMKNFFPLFGKNISDQFTSLVDIADGADLLIGTLLDSVGKSVADYKGIKYLYYSCVPLTFKSSSHTPMNFPIKKLPRWLNGLAWSGYEILVSKLLLPIVNGNRKKLGMKEIKRFLDYTLENVIISADPVLAPMPRDVRSNYIQTGYWFLEEDKELDDELNQFIAAGAPPVFIGFGSMPDPSPAQTTKILQEIIDSQRFRLIISSGWAGLKVNKANSNTLIVNYVPHTKLFPKMAAVVHHGGAGTTHTTARAGVPQVVVPHGIDQFYWGERVFSLQIGPKPVNRSRLTSQNLINAIHQAVTNAEIRKNAKQIGEILSQQNGLEEALQYFESFTTNK